ncbi:MAG: bifunctional folylpolyglutamate synthase/dihydrofolate synthase [Myxococcota bacterium]
MTPQEGLAHFASLSPSSIKMGLERVRDALARLGHPERRFPAVHVAGTNGKGSTCAIAASCLRTRYRTGLYTSPHLIRPNERIQLDGVEIDDETFGRRIAEVVDVLGADHELTYFEFGTIVAFWHFAQERVDVAVIEVGLGGRLDATTACTPQVTCITPIGFDHMEYLGHTLEAIAGEKAGIIKPGVPLVLSRGFPISVTGPSRVLHEGVDFAVSRDAAGLVFRGCGRELGGLRLALKGEHQHQNLALALACVCSLADFPLSDDELRRGVAAARWPGRLEEFPGTPLVVLDGAHNPAGVEVLLRALDSEYGGRPIHLVFGVFADKDSAPMMRALFPRVDALHLAPIASPRSKDPRTYEALARSLHPRVQVHPDAETALAVARREAPPDAVVLVAGSLFLVGQLRRQLG